LQQLSSVVHPSSSAFAWRLAVFYAALFAALGVQLPFLPVWLAARGLDAGAIGVVLALPMIVRVLAIPIATRSADRHDALRLTIVIAAATAVLGYLALALAHAVVAIAIVFTLASVAYTPIMPLADAYALRGLARLGRAYGPVRLWGSAAFIAGSLGAGVLLDLMPARDLIWLVVAALVVTAVAALALAPLAPHEASARARPRSSARVLLRDPAFLTAAVAASLIQASHAVYYGFSALAWQAASLDGAVIGTLWALAVVAEIVLFAISGRLNLAPTTLLVAGASGAAVRWGAMALDPAPALLPLLQWLHALSFGATHLGALGCVARAAPPELGATAQGYLVVAVSIAMAAAMGIAGVLYARSESLAYGAMAFAAALGGVFAVIAGRLRVTPA
jgi:MFS transporter, PPP family, 3-phenylpropionic acid transporter